MDQEFEDFAPYSNINLKRKSTFDQNSSSDASSKKRRVKQSPLTAKNSSGKRVQFSTMKTPRTNEHQHLSIEHNLNRRDTNYSRGGTTSNARSSIFNSPMEREMHLKLYAEVLELIEHGQIKDAWDKVDEKYQTQVKQSQSRPQDIIKMINILIFMAKFFIQVPDLKFHIDDREKEKIKIDQDAEIDNMKKNYSSRTDRTIQSTRQGPSSVTSTLELLEEYLTLLVKMLNVNEIKAGMEANNNPTTLDMRRAINIRDNKRISQSIVTGNEKALIKIQTREDDDGENQFLRHFNGIQKNVKDIETIQIKGLPNFADYRYMLYAYGTLASFYNCLSIQMGKKIIQYNEIYSQQMASQRFWRSFIKNDQPQLREEQNRMQKYCQEAYKMYIKLVEQFYLPVSLETSNAYFLVGVYYASQEDSSSITRGIACFKKALAIRVRIFGKELHDSCADCLINLGILLGRKGLLSEAEEQFIRAAEITTKLKGSQSLKTANINEELGKLYLEIGNYEKSYEHLMDCYSSRKGLLKANFLKRLKGSKMYFYFPYSELEFTSNVYDITKYRDESTQRVKLLLKFLEKQINAKLQNCSEDKNQNNLILLSQKQNANLAMHLDDSFSYLNPSGESIGAQVFWETFGENKQIIQADEKQQFNELTAYNTPVTPNNVSEIVRQHDFSISKSYHRVIPSSPYQSAQSFKPEAQLVGQSSKSHLDQVPIKKSIEKVKKESSRLKMDLEDQELNALVDQGMNGCIGISRQRGQQNFEKYQPYIITLLLSLSEDQFYLWKQSHNQYSYDTKSSDDILYFSHKFKESLDVVQVQIFNESNIWRIPRSKIFKKSDREMIADKQLSTVVKRLEKKIYKEREIYNSYKQQMEELIQNEPEENIENIERLDDQIQQYYDIFVTQYSKLEDKLYKETYQKVPFIHSMSLEFIKFEEQSKPKEILKQKSFFTTFSELVFTSKKFMKKLSKSQTNLLRNLNRFIPVLRYFFLTLQEGQVKEIQKILNKKSKQITDQKQLQKLLKSVEDGLNKGQNASLIPKRQLNGDQPSFKALTEDLSSNSDLQEMQCMLDYMEETHAMIWAFSHIDEFRKVHPDNFGFNEEFILDNVNIEDDLDRLDWLKHRQMTGRMLGLSLNYNKENFQEEDDLLTDDDLSHTEEVGFDPNAIRLYIYDMVEELMVDEDAFDFYRSVLKIFERDQTRRQNATIISGADKSKILTMFEADSEDEIVSEKARTEEDIDFCNIKRQDSLNRPSSVKNSEKSPKMQIKRHTAIHHSNTVVEIFDIDVNANEPVSKLSPKRRVTLGPLDWKNQATQLRKRNVGNNRMRYSASFKNSNYYKQSVNRHEQMSRISGRTKSRQSLGFKKSDTTSSLPRSSIGLEKNTSLNLGTAEERTSKMLSTMQHFFVNKLKEYENQRFDSPQKVEAQMIEEEVSVSESSREENYKQNPEDQKKENKEFFDMSASHVSASEKQSVQKQQEREQEKKKDKVEFWSKMPNMWDQFKVQKTNDHTYNKAENVAEFIGDQIDKNALFRGTIEEKTHEVIKVMEISGMDVIKHLSRSSVVDDVKDCITQFEPNKAVDNDSLKQIVRMAATNTKQSNNQTSMMNKLQMSLRQKIERQREKALNEKKEDLRKMKMEAIKSYFNPKEQAQPEPSQAPVSQTSNSLHVPTINSLKPPKKGVLSFEDYKRMKEQQAPPVLQNKPTFPKFAQLKPVGAIRKAKVETMQTQLHDNIQKIQPIVQNIPKLPENASKVQENLAVAKLAADMMTLAKTIQSKQSSEDEDEHIKDTRSIDSNDWSDSD